MQADVGRKTFSKGVCDTLIMKETRIAILLGAAAARLFCAQISAPLLRAPQGSVCRLVMPSLQLEKAVEESHLQPHWTTELKSEVV